uniref:Derlin n=2 Tax=Lygus hesperus TaxID=30085 RepID=A0A146KKZ4_LYGHE
MCTAHLHAVWATRRLWILCSFPWNLFAQLWNFHRTTTFYALTSSKSCFGTFGGGDPCWGTTHTHTHTLQIIAIFGGFMYMSSAFTSMLTYLRSRKQDQAQVLFMGLFPLRASYLPFLLLLLSYLEGNIAQDIIGILLGHTYYFLTDIYPRMTCREYVCLAGSMLMLGTGYTENCTSHRLRLLQTPPILCYIFRQPVVPPSSFYNYIKITQGFRGYTITGCVPTTFVPLQPPVKSATATFPTSSAPSVAGS